MIHPTSSLNISIIHSPDSHIIQHEESGVIRNIISRLLPYPSDMVYKDRFGVYYVNDSFYKSIKIGSLSLTNVTVISKAYPSNMIYEDRFGVYRVNQKMYSSDKKEMLPIIGEIQVPKYDFNLNQENQKASNDSLYQCRQLMKKNGKSDAITLSSRFLYGFPPIHFNNSKSWNSYISKARDDAKNKPKGKIEDYSIEGSYFTTPNPFIDGPFVHTSLGTFVENVRYNTQKSIIELLIPHAHPSTRNND